jgi:molybdate transport system ATP-binding protein
VGAAESRRVTLALREGAIVRGGFRLEASFEAASEGVTVVFGPSGAGKSMLLAALAGLEPLAAGRLELSGEVLEDAATRMRVAAHRRGVGLVFQEARLFPHLTVRGNLAYAAKRRPDRGAGMDIDALARRMDLAALLDRGVRTLSGGEKSRVALARALAGGPRVLLLDEPFAALDGRRRRAYLALLREIARTDQLPMLVVTHAVEDAAYLADHVVALQAGRVIASGAADVVLNGAAFAGLLDERDAGARIDAGRLAAGREQGCGVWVRADNVMIAVQRPEGLSARNIWSGVILAIEPEADGAVLVRMQAEPGLLLGRISEAARQELELTPGRPVFAVLKTHAA